MRKIKFRIDGSTAPYNMGFILREVKKTFKEAVKDEIMVGAYCWDCYISVNKQNLDAAFEIIRGFASHAIKAST